MADAASSPVLGTDGHDGAVGSDAGNKFQSAISAWRSTVPPSFSLLPSLGVRPIMGLQCIAIAESVTQKEERKNNH